MTSNAARPGKGPARSRRSAACRAGEALSPDVVPLNAVIEALAAADHLEHAVDVLCRARAHGCVVLGNTYCLLLSGLARAHAHGLVVRVLETMRAAGVRCTGEVVDAALFSLLATVRRRPEPAASARARASTWQSAHVRRARAGAPRRSAEAAAADAAQRRPAARPCRHGRRIARARRPARRPPAAL